MLDVSNNDLHHTEHFYDLEGKPVSKIFVKKATILGSSNCETMFYESQKKKLESLNISGTNLNIGQLNEILNLSQIAKLDC